ncbi:MULTISPECIES: 2Fe-2S iron-sulfur cluster binding domain-containing protein [Janthinobacterium]|uniref:2Fe-2S iron-sulfur cluster-binding protein n=1 Tax=Janthinobacterium TaxID=29580 RepID=UPI0004461B5E|nr:MULTISPECIES: 2Fe-2S iron-sulfur cluster binding domain-containing protein [Janthinobacterium]EZP36717.1 Electron transfer component of chlorobenzoate 1,2-dioxygenase [Janthinobacterium lividum]MBW3499869.1 2Fe-2S iron-sulfur cluster binding domain-containing protein [Janthinobacterium sp. NKUCC08_JDC]
MTNNTVAPATGGGARRCQITLGGGQEGFAAGRGDLLLLAALEQGINYPHSCRVGTCGRCKTRLVSGQISPLVDFALSPLTNEELRDGYILACQAKVRSDLCVEVELIDHQVVLPQSVPGTVSHWQQLPGDVIDLRITLERPLVFEAGQYAALAVSGSFVRRSFSFYDAPPGAQGSTQVGFLIKRLPGGRFSEWLAAQDRRGVRIWVEAPFGQMGLDDTPRDALCIAGGTGIAPILSIAEQRLQRYPQQRVTIVFGVRGASDLFALDKLERLRQLAGAGRLRVIPVLSHEPRGSAWQGRRGLVTDVLDESLASDYHQLSTFVCGALPMVVAVEKRLLALGVPAGLIHADKFEASGS